jgi:hypothetical protein
MRGEIEGEKQKKKRAFWTFYPFHPEELFCQTIKKQF